MSSVIFDGHDLSTLLICGDPDISILDAQPKYTNSDNRNGSFVTGGKYGNASVSFAIAVLGNARERRDKLSTLGAWLDVDEPKPLILPDTPDRYYLAVPDGALDLNRGFGGDISKLSFSITEPIAYGREKSFFVTAGTSKSYSIGGTAATRPYITASALRNNSAGVWGMMLDSNTYLQIPLANDNYHDVIIDCENRTAYVDGIVTLPTLSSDWFELTPGAHILSVHQGTGGATLTYRERWY